MEPLTIETITDSQIRTLAYEAGCAGDYLMRRFALEALADPMRETVRRQQCVDAINAARAQR